MKQLKSLLRIRNGCGLLPVVALALLLFQFSDGLKGQPFQSLFHAEYTSWTMGHQQLYGNELGKIFTGQKIDSTSWELFYSYTECCDPIIAGTIREELTTGKVWITPDGGGDEMIVMDMGLQVGETFIIFAFPVMVVDVFYLGGRKVIEFDYPIKWDEPLRFIEGVGPNASFLFNCGCSGILSPYVACKYEGEELVYVNSNSYFIGCEMNTTGVDRILHEQVNISYVPNPGYLILQNSGSITSNGLITISDLSGRCVYKAAVEYPFNPVSTAQLSPGVYIAVFSYGNEEAVRLKFMKH